MDREDFRSASGLRPMSAFVVIATVVATVAARVSVLSLEGREPDSLVTVGETGCDLGYSIRDARGRTLATFVERFELHVSPRTMWQAHTPDYMASRIAEVIGAPDPEPLLASLLPDAVDGEIEVRAWELSGERAERVRAWIGDRQVPGMRLVASDAHADHWRLRWTPEVTLAQATRRGRRGEPGPWRWTRRIADGLADCLWGELEESPQSVTLREERRDVVWEALLPARWNCVVHDVPPQTIFELRQMLDAEGVQSHQMWIEAERERLQPRGGFGLLGTWGFLDDDPTTAVARGGLERLSDAFLADPAWSEVLAEPVHYEFQTTRVARRGSRTYYQGSTERDEAPSVRLTLDLELQERMGEILEACRVEHSAALVEGIVLDVESGAVLALEAASTWPAHSFPPIHHQFTPGSTFKVLTMAIAVNEGLVAPSEPIDVGYGHWRVPGSSRVIHEAEGHRTGVITASECLAWSQNAGLVQIGLRIPDELFHGTLERLGYGDTPATGLGNEASGYLPALEGDGWSHAYTHASVCIGHEVAVTLWQHAAGLATVMRGGEWRPLTLVAGIEKSGRFVAAPPRAGRMVLHPQACAIVREMMELGAEEGTGRHVFRPELSMATKTGTAEKTPSEVSMHVLGPAVAAAAEAGRAFTGEDFRALPKRGSVANCYTSSMCAVGTHPDGDRELLVLVVVEEPSGKQKFGSKVAGPAAIQILEAALGLEPVETTAPPQLADSGGFRISGSSLTNPSPDPWAEGPWEGESHEELGR